LLSPSLDIITRDPDVSCSIDFSSYELSTSFQAVTGDKSYTALPEGGAHVLTYTHSKSDDDDASFAVLNKVDYELKYTATSDIYLVSTQIRVATQLTAWVNIDVTGGNAEGDLAKFLFVTFYDIGVNAEGQISVTLTRQDLLDNSETPETSGWTEFITAGTIGDTIDDLKATLQGYLASLASDESASIAQMLNGSSGWVFPGGQTFSFSDAQFSDNQDLIAHVMYLDPTS